MVKRIPVKPAAVYAAKARVELDKRDRRNTPSWIVELSKTSVQPALRPEVAKGSLGDGQINHRGADLPDAGGRVDARSDSNAELLRVLVVDDEELFRSGLAMLLGAEPDIEVVGEAGDGEEGTALAESVAPNVVLLDIRMPKRSGLEACSAIKQAVPSAKIIMLTVSDDEADLYEAVKSGASGYLLKGSSIEAICEAVRAVADGQSLISPSMAVKLIDEFKQMSRPEGENPAGLRLTERELEVLRLVARGLNNREVAKQLSISENTARNHIRNILEKLQLHSRMEAVMYAVADAQVELEDPSTYGSATS